jgi:hypothetical protein
MKATMIKSVISLGVLICATASMVISSPIALAADDPLAPIKKAVENEYNSCGGPGPKFGTLREYSVVLEAIAQKYARTGKLDPVPPGFGRLRAARGWSDPESKAIRAALNGGGRAAIAEGCSFSTLNYTSSYGVGFVRINSVDYVTIVVGYPPPQPPAQPCNPSRERCGPILK